MINLESLLKVQGVIAALRFSDDGSLIESVGELASSLREFRMFSRGGQVKKANGIG
jgi:roadblock/LC7 domain-containing protein